MKKGFKIALLAAILCVPVLMLFSSRLLPQSSFGAGSYEIGKSLSSGFYTLLTEGEGALTLQGQDGNTLSSEQILTAVPNEGIIFYAETGDRVSLSGSYHIKKVTSLQDLKSKTFIGTGTLQGKTIQNELNIQSNVTLLITAPFEFTGSAYSIYTTAREGAQDMLNIHEVLDPGEERTVTLNAAQYINVTQCTLKYVPSAEV